MHVSTVLFLAVVVAQVLANREIHDPLNIFCGSTNCYDILGVKRTSTIKEIKSAYRKLSLTNHPDKSDAANATEVFRRISKAYQVVTGNSSRDLFNYYLDHPRDYFKVSGTHYFRNPPKMDLRIVLLVLLTLWSVLMHVLQTQRYEFAVKALTRAAICNFGAKSNGTKESQEVFRRASEMYESRVKSFKKDEHAAAAAAAVVAAKDNKLSALHVQDEDGKPLGKTKMQKDPIFLATIDEVISQVQFEGPSRKPKWEDALVVQVFKAPYLLYQWATAPKNKQA